MGTDNFPTSSSSLPSSPDDRDSGPVPENSASPGSSNGDLITPQQEESSIVPAPADNNDDLNENTMSNSGNNTPANEGFSLARPFAISDRTRTQQIGSNADVSSPSLVRVDDVSPPAGGSGSRGRERQRDGSEPTTPVRCVNPASEINGRLDTQVEVRVYPCNNSQGGGKKKFTTFTIKPEVRIGSQIVLRSSVSNLQPY